LLDKEGAETVTMRPVAGAVGITAMAVYRHYQNRADLLNALADVGFQELAGRLAGAASQAILRNGSRKCWTSFWDLL
jgi:AcrR family transcriptional regulator